MADFDPRYLVAVLALLAAGCAVAYLRWTWEVLQVRIQRVAPPVVTLLVLWAYGSLEAAAHGAPPGARVPLGVVVFTWLVVAMLTPLPAQRTAPCGLPSCPRDT